MTGAVGGRPRWWRAVGVGATVVALGGAALAAATHRDLEDRRQELAATRTRVAATATEVEATRQALVAADQRLRAVRRARDRTDQAAEATRVELDTRGTETDRLRDALVLLAAQRDGARLSLGAARNSAWARGTDIATLERCLAGVARATALRRAGDRAAAVLTLASVSEPCLAAQLMAAADEPSPPLFPFSFADPFVIGTADGYFAYATNGGGGNVQLVRSSDLRTWEWVGEALPDLPAWAAPHRTWAPSVLRRGDRYVLYYTVRERATGLQCLSTATASRPQGPFVDPSTKPFLCQRDHGGSIDASPFVAADGQPYLVWKSDGEAIGDRAHLWSQRLSPDGLSVTGPRAALLGPDQAWERRTVEGPSMVQDGGTFHLLYSANAWSTRDYAVGFAVCRTPLGPCRKPTAGPILRSQGTFAGPGGQEVVRDRSGGLWLSFHAWTEPDIGYPNRRTLRLRRLSFAFGQPVIGAAR